MKKQVKIELTKSENVLLLVLSHYLLPALIMKANTVAEIKPRGKMLTIKHSCVNCLQLYFLSLCSLSQFFPLIRFCHSAAYTTIREIASRKLLLLHIL